MGIQALIFELLNTGSLVVSRVGLINESTVYCLLGYMAAVFGVYKLLHGNSHCILYEVSLAEPEKVKRIKHPFLLPVI